MSDEMVKRIVKETGLPDGTWKLGLSTVDPGDLVQAATARTLELVAEWLRKEANGYVKNELRAQAMALRIAAREIDSGAFDAWCKERETRGG